ncbi:xanthine dehydrogenase accessory protein XdhC [Castellaniella sp. GW247-6E4]|uniref:xanthine dehydrogenase accessory protein XdhC n=1 Tax=Castellaniella sp. GW247-6E4 TaxID=3140380 RepID=UPI0033159BA6
MMHDWIDQALWSLERGQALVLVTVAWAQGSTPREAGAKMLVSDRQQWFTIGGGHLEWVAIDVARKRLHATHVPDRWIERLPLGPSLGQCCGGMVHLLFERLGAADQGWLSDLRERLRADCAAVREVGLGGGETQPWVRLRDAPLEPGAALPAKLLAQDGHGRPLFAEVIAPAPLNVVLFGAGHVGRALVHILGTLPCRVTWVDEREDLFPDLLPANVRIEATDTPEAVIDEAPPQSCYLIMTHDHALDQRLCEQLLRRDDIAYFGLIGSLTKRRKFEHRFQARGISEARYQRIVCPIGEPGIDGKQPAVIAVAVAAQILRVRAEVAQRAASPIM